MLQKSSFDFNRIKNEKDLDRLTQMISDFFSDVTGIQLLAADFMQAKHGTSASKGRKTHEASQLKKDEEQGVYVFIVDREHCLKVGFAGKKSPPRWNSHHYNLDHSTPSTLPKSILKDGESFVEYLSESVNKRETTNFLLALRTAEQYLKEHPGQPIEKKLSNRIRSWLENNTLRMEFKISAKDKESMFAARFLESFLHFLLTPRYEGRVTTIK